MDKIVIYGVDKCHRMSTEQEAEVSLDYFGANWKWGCRCPRCGVESPDGHLYALGRRAKINICESCSYAEEVMKELLEIAVEAYRQKQEIKAAAIELDMRPQKMKKLRGVRPGGKRV